jgi:monooxygenase
LLDFSSGYVRRADGVLPKQGQRMPWRVHQNYVKDLASFTFGSISDGTMEFLRRSERSQREQKRTGEVYG